jgi:hypothetical protein
VVGGAGVNLSDALKAQRPSKYGSKRAELPELPGRVFASKREAAAARVLLAQQQAGVVRALSFQVRFRLDVGDEHVCDYVADFTYDERCPSRDTSMGEAWVRVVADAKGYRTDAYRLKKKLMKAIHGVEIREL